MTQAQLGGRAGISRQSVQDFERAEAERRITLESLDRLARALGCRMVYALVPRAARSMDCASVAPWSWPKRSSSRPIIP